jgi:hypothetical protein
MKITRCVQSLLVFLSLALASQLATAQSQVVIPPGFEAAEGDALTAGFPDGFRFQQLAPNAWFDALPAGKHRLTAISFRPDAGITAPFDVLLGNLELRVSTTDKEPDGLSFTYSENHGADETLVYSGPLQLTTQNVLASDGVTKAFDIKRTFTTPFDYDPAAGNLLIDFLIQPEPGMTVPDGNTDFVFANFSDVSGLADAIHQVSHNGPPQNMAASTFFGGNVLQLTFVPEPSGVLLLAIGIGVSFGACHRQRERRDSVSPTAMSRSMLGC